MKIVKLDEFLAMPAGTLFAKYKPCVFGDLCIKEESIPEYRDFIYQPIVDSLDANDSNQHFDMLDESLKTGKSIPMDFDCLNRDGFYDADQLYAVFERADVEALIERLKQALSLNLPEGVVKNITG
jgi:hypothetical protein